MTTITYKDVAPGATSNAQVSATHALTGSDVSRLPFGVDSVPIITLEPDRWLLNGKFVPMDGHEIGFWSDNLSDGNCAFADPPVITSVFTKQYNSSGITLIFDEKTGEYCTKVNVKWYRRGTVVSNNDFYPDSCFYFCENIVKVWDKIVVTLLKTSLPYRRAKLCGIVYGKITVFDMSEIIKAEVINEMHPISETLPASTLRWTLYSRNDIDYLFQLKQAFQVEANGKQIGTYYIDNFQRRGKRIYDLEAYDALGVLAEIDYPGGAFLDGIWLDELVEDIVGPYFDVDIDPYFADHSNSNHRLKGIIAPCSRRDALQQAAFAAMAWITTDGGSRIRVLPPRRNTPTQSEIVGEDATYSTSAKAEAIVTKVIVTMHEYTQTSAGSIEIGGRRYNETATLYTVANPDITATDKHNVLEFPNATLVSQDNGADVANWIYSFWSRRSVIKSKIVWTGQTLGRVIATPLPWGGYGDGHLKRMHYTLSNTVAADCEILSREASSSR